MVRLCPPPRNLRVLDSKTNVLHAIEATGPPPPPPKMAIFCPKKGLKMPTLDQKQYFLGLGVRFKAPHPILQMSDSEKHVLQGIGAGNG